MEEKLMGEVQDPVLDYLLNFNKIHAIKYKNRRLIPPKGLQEMLDNYEKFKLNRDEPEVIYITTPEVSEIDELYKLID